MRDKQRIYTIPEIVFFLIVLAVFSTGSLYADEGNKYLNAVRSFADRILQSGRDIYGPNTTPLFADGLNVKTMEPVRWECRGETWVLSNFASQQPLLRTLDGISGGAGA